MQNSTKFQNIALLLLRLIIAAVFIQAGYAKFFFWSDAPEGMSELMVNLMRFLSIVEPLGAIAILAGFMTRLAAGGLSIIMVGAILVMQFVMHMGFSTAQGAGWNFPLVILAGCIALMAFGPGDWSLRSERVKEY